MSLNADEDFTSSIGEEGRQDEYILDDNYSFRDFDEESDESEALNHSADFEEYVDFVTDYEKYQYDRAQWGQMPESRNYHIAKKQRKDKGEPQTQQNSAQVDNGRDQEGSKALSKPRKRKKNQPDVPCDETEEVITDEGLNFDRAGNLWRTHWIGERATFHHWVRPGLSELENAKGTYDWPRQRGIGNWDVTCYNEVQEHWGLSRPHYAPVMFEWERLDRTDPIYQLDNLYYQGLLVIDYWGTLVRNFREIPLVISSVFEGGFIEPATRLHSKIAYEDIRARMPPFIQLEIKGEIVTKPLPKANALAGRSRRFRESAGAVSWLGREGSDDIKLFIEEIVRPVVNSTLGSRDLTKQELKRLRLINHGTKPLRARVGTTQEAKEKYDADTRKAAGATPAVDLPQDAQSMTKESQEADENSEEVMELGMTIQQEIDNRSWEANAAAALLAAVFPQEAEAKSVTDETQKVDEEVDEAMETGVDVQQESSDRVLEANAACVAPAADFPEEAKGMADESQQVDEKVENTIEPESDAQQGSYGRGWDANLLLDYDTLYNDEEDGFMENPLASAEKERQ